MSITTEEAERLAKWCGTGLPTIAAALRSLAAERDALRAEKVNLQDDLVSAERERAHQHGRADRNAAEYAREQKKREQLQAENEKLRAVLQRIVENEDQFSMAWAAEIARAALGEKE
jgi:hypothetical protein